MINIAIVDDHMTLRRGLITIMGIHPRIKVMYEASNGREFIDQLKNGPLPDIAIIDVNMPVLDGNSTLLVLQEIYPQIKVIIFSFLREEDLVMNMISKGACGYVNKGNMFEDFTEIIITVHEKGFYLNNLVKKEFFRERLSNAKKTGFSGKEYITAKEIEFIKLSSTNLTYKEIAMVMGLSFKTVENYRDSLFYKLGIKNRAALTLFGVKNGLIDINSSSI